MIRKDETLPPCTLEELNARIAKSEQDAAEGRYMSHQELFESINQKMQKAVNIIFYMIILLCISSCKNKYEEPEWMSKIYPEFDKERHVIYDKKQLREDIKGEIAVLLNHENPRHFDYVCELLFFNYGKDIKLYNGCEEDCFITSLGTIKYAHALKKEDNIIFIEKKHNEKYGDWALVNLNINNTLIKHVYMTPLSVCAYNNGNRDSFIFIQFNSGNKLMNVLFIGGPTENILVNDLPNVILSRSEFSHNINAVKSDPGQFWQTISQY